MPKVRGKSYNDISWQGFRLGNTLQGQIAREKDPERRQQLENRLQKVLQAQYRYMENIENNKARKNDMAKRKAISDRHWHAIQNKDEEGAKSALQEYKKVYNRSENRKFKGYQNAATTASVR